MAFNFNWSPLTADPEFYSRARDLLTAALNKSPKPPIIVADILVTELNLGTTPPDLEILEIGDLADDRFRGIFKMEYSGDAFLTLQTKVQANPLNTHLSTAPSFTSPQPLAASSPLTIPLQITLSDFRLSGFVILVFSKAKGITLVFRNDPLESLVVSSTFDSIPFIKDYLQKEIEKQLRNLFQEELPAIIHRLSLRWWGQDYDSASSNTLRPQPMPQSSTFNSGPSLSNKSSLENLNEQPEGRPHDSFSFNNDLESDTLSSKSLLRLATLTDSQRTLSLFTPSIRDAIYRAWAVAGDRSDPTSTPSSTNGTHSSTTYSLDSTAPARPGLVAMASSLSVSSSSGLGPNGRPVTRSSALGKKKKTRVVNLRRKKDTTQSSDADTSSVTGSESITSSMEVGYEEKEHHHGSEASEASSSIPEISIPPPLAADARRSGEYVDVSVSSPLRSPTGREPFLANRPHHHAASDAKIPAAPATPSPPPLPAQTQPQQPQHISFPTEKDGSLFPASDEYSGEPSAPISLFSGPYSQLSPQLSPMQHGGSSVPMENPFVDSRGRTASSGGIAEKAWMMKMAGEMARRWAEERVRREKAEELLEERDRRRRNGSSPPPAYKLQE
ncbi:ERMES complex subunit [Orbilia brochopaga]|uniref:Mitochondrial distribution and morphology protein 34 n=1 Tax=Orbilia brochopaga TaxID=3140254 RepID=A0AAV9UKL0_9PEZI